MKGRTRKAAPKPGSPQDLRRKNVDEQNTRGESAPGKVEGDDEKLKQNREQLGVDEEHKTPEMEKGHRGTFP